MIQHKIDSFNKANQRLQNFTAANPIIQSGAPKGIEQEESGITESVDAQGQRRLSVEIPDQ